MDNHEIKYETQCRCGWRSEPQASAKGAEIQGWMHEQKMVRRPLSHDTNVAFEVSR